MKNKKYKNPNSILLIIFTTKFKVLLLKKNSKRDLWQSVTGSIELGEDPYDTALRELQEETGINKQKSDLIFDDLSHKFMIYSEWIDRYKESTYSNKEYIFSLKLNDEVSVKLSKEHSSYKWVDLNEAIHLVFSWTNKAALKAIPNFIY
ncbi:MAG: dihydroneopterin triphosphate diphosphatase [Hydrogenophilales bacterium]